MSEFEDALEGVESGIKTLERHVRDSKKRHESFEETEKYLNKQKSIRRSLKIAHLLQTGEVSFDMAWIGGDEVCMPLDDGGIKKSSRIFRAMATQLLKETT